MTTNVFAYGSNMCTARIRDRVESARPLSTGCINGYQVRFHKRGVDGSAKADAFYTGNKRDRVWGVVFQIAVDHKPILDRFESLGVGYDDRLIDVETTEGGRLEAWMYVARFEAITTGLQLFSWYRDLMLAGARQHGLPHHYCEWLSRIDTHPDPDPERDLGNRWLLPPGTAFS